MRIMSNKKEVTIKNTIEIMLDEKLYRIYMTNNRCTAIYLVVSLDSLVNIDKSIEDLTGYTAREFIEFVEESKRIDAEDLEDLDFYDFEENEEVKVFNFDEEILDLDF